MIRAIQILFIAILSTACGSQISLKSAEESLSGTSGNSNPSGEVTTSAHTINITLNANTNIELPVQQGTPTSCSVSNLSANLSETTSCSCTAGKCSVGVTASACSSGSGTFDFTMEDAAGNTSSSSATINIQSSVTLPTSINVVPVYNEAGKRNWNDYISNDSGSIGDVCVAATHTKCLHGGEHKEVSITGITSCADLSLVDNLDAFDWKCDDTSGTAVFSTQKLKDTARLADLLNSGGNAFKNNFVILSHCGEQVNSSSTTWWTNPIVNLDDGVASPDTTETIYTITSDVSRNYDITVDKLALVIYPNVSLTRDSTSTALNTTGDFLWIEGDFKEAASTAEAYMHLRDIEHSVLRNVTINDSLEWALRIDNVSDSRFEQVKVLNAQNYSIRMTGSDSYFKDITITGGTSYGLALWDGTNNNYFEDITTSHNQNGGTYVRNSGGNTFKNLKSENNVGNGLSSSFNSIGNRYINVNVAYNNNVGIDIDNSPSTFFYNVKANNNYNASSVFGSGIVLGANSPNSTVINALITANNDNGIHMQRSANSVIKNVTVARNAEYGFWIEYSNNHSVFENIDASFNGDTGISLSRDNQQTVLMDLVSTENTGFGVNVSSSYEIKFSGKLFVDNNTMDPCNSNITSIYQPGLIDTTCSDGTSTGLSSTYSGQLSDAYYMDGVTAAAAIIGKINTADTTNQSDDSSGAAVIPADASSFDWLSFDTNTRSWGADPTNECVSTGNCYIWDDIPSLTDTGGEGGRALKLNVHSCPEAEKFHTKTSERAMGALTFNGSNSFDAGDAITINGTSLVVGTDWNQGANLSDSINNFVTAVNTTFSGSITATATNDELIRFVADNIGDSYNWTLSETDNATNNFTFFSGFMTGGLTTTTQTYLIGAYEILDDKDSSGSIIGDEDGLCESGESCMIQPNFGYYQGHGNIVPASQTVANTPTCADIGTGGTIQNVTLFKYDQNGK